MAKKEKNKLDAFENEVLDFMENQNSESVPNLETEKERFKQIAKDQIEKKKRINLRLLESDLTRMKAEAIREGLPYQTLISSIIHKYATGQLVTKDIKTD